MGEEEGGVIPQKSSQIILLLSTLHKDFHDGWDNLFLGQFKHSFDSDIDNKLARGGSR